VGYGKAAMVFHMVRRQIGEKAFWQALRHLAETRMFDQIGWDDFATTFSRFANQDLRPFFTQWVRRAGAPTLSLEEVQARRQGDGWLVQGRIRQQGQAFDLLLPLHLETADDRTTLLEIPVSGRLSTFEMRAQETPRRLLVDPDAHVLRHLHAVEIPASVNNVRGSESLIVVVSADLPPELANASRLLLQALRKERASVVAEPQVRPEQLKGRDLLFIGLPRHYSQPLLDAAPVSFSSDGFTFAGQTYQGPSAALFAAVTPEDQPKVTWAYFIPSSAAAAEDAARRIPHYGKYSYLVFDQGANRTKGIWDVRNSPLIHNFNKEDQRP